jgi:hypothetical protein
MRASLQALLTNLIDYAGLFPPANLPLDEAIRNYSRYRTEGEAWMLGRFVCPADRLVELDRYVGALFAQGPPLALSVLAGKGNTFAELHAALHADMKSAAEFQARHGERVKVDVLEIRLPALPAERPPEALAEALLQTAEIIESALRAPATPYYEATPGPGYEDVLAKVLPGLTLATSIRAVQSNTFCRPAGFKLRCGGLDASAVPSVTVVARIIAHCRQQGIPLKATAGLHHPVRRLDRALGGHVHGFVNLFTAAVMAHAHGLNDELIRRILEEEDPQQFAFDDEHLWWGDFGATGPEIAAAREHLATSFGSCSFDEPRDDLRALGWL